MATYDIGDLVTLTSTVTVNDGNAVLVVTNPAGAVTTVSGIAFTSGAYTGTYRPTVAGLHSITFTTTNNVVQDVFEVRGTFTGIISLDDARTWLRLRVTDTFDDAKLADLIETATDLIEDVTGPMTTLTYTEQFSGGTSTYVVMHPPVKTITMLTEYYGTQALVLTEQPLGAQTNQNGFTVDYSTGQLSRRSIGGMASMFAPGHKNCVLVYTASRLPIPSAIQMACRELVKHLYTFTQVPSGKARMGNNADADNSAPITYAVPNFVLDMIPLKYRRTPGIA